MAKKKSSSGVNNTSNELTVKLIPVYESELEFQTRKNEVQDIIAKIIIHATTRGRPRNDQEEELKNAA